MPRKRRQLALCPTVRLQAGRYPANDSKDSGLLVGMGLNVHTKESCIDHGSTNLGSRFADRLAPVRKRFR